MHTSFPQSLTPKPYMHISSVQLMTRTTPVLFWIYYANDIWKRAIIVKFIVVEVSPVASCLPTLPTNIFLSTHFPNTSCCLVNYCLCSIDSLRIV